MPFFKRNDVFAGRYQLAELMGEGNSSEVWKASDQMGGEAVVVLKIHNPKKGFKDEGLPRFRQEFSRSRELTHPHLLKVNHFDVWDGIPYLVMPFSPLGSLASLLVEEDSFSERQVALVLSQIGSALAALHQQDPPMLHHDVNPVNIVRSQPDNFLLADFGITPLNRPALQPSSAEKKLVNPSYAPPESFEPSQETNASGDIFSLGVTLVEMCTKTLPWDGAGGQALLKGGKVPSLPEQYSAELNELLQACLSPVKGKRPSAKELQRKGQHFLETGNWNLQEKGEEGKPARKLIPYLLATAAFVLFMASIYWAYQHDQLAGPAEKVEKVDPYAEQNQEIDQLLIATLEDELEEMARRARELEEENRRLKGGEPATSILENRQNPLLEERPAQAAEQEPPKKEENKARIPEQGQRKALESPKTQTSTPVAASPSGENKVPVSPNDLEEQLNKISDPALSGKARASWKQETMAQFAEDAIRIVDETEGTPKRYSASIFLNLLYNVPHIIEVKEVKTNQNQKVTELRLTMQTKM